MARCFLVLMIIFLMLPVSFIGMALVLFVSRLKLNVMRRDYLW